MFFSEQFYSLLLIFNDLYYFYLIIFCQWKLYQCLYFLDKKGISILVTFSKELYFLLSLGLFICCFVYFEELLSPSLWLPFTWVLPIYHSVFVFNVTFSWPSHVVISASNPFHTRSNHSVFPFSRHSLFSYVLYILFYFFVSMSNMYGWNVDILLDFVICRS